tara:strand:+ start:1216 stop:1689 length:474 start_codon:yes stop_codon:yes gene_type:complete
MRVTKERLKQIIKEELKIVLAEASAGDADYLGREVAMSQEYYRKNETFRKQFVALSRLAAPKLRLKGKSDMGRNSLENAAQAIGAITSEMIRQDRDGFIGLGELLDALIDRAENVAKDPEALQALQQINSSYEAKFKAVDDEDTEASKKPDLDLRSE